MNHDLGHEHTGIYMKFSETAVGTPATKKGYLSFMNSWDNVQYSEQN